MAMKLQCSSCHGPLPEGVSDGLCPSCVSGGLSGGRRGRRAKQGKWPGKFGGYEVLERLGMGGMGVVYKARQRKHDRVVALKMIRKNQFASAHEIRRFRSETEAVARLDHPHI